ncbi:nucleotide-binding universal stress UspA family protein [Bacillus ectoiniformans]|uniref:universal stress protein n=1 Tax=Bacillus ectoiniformans TaxID=1494429 RepID=UPI0019573AE3|nr:universal stress protein [Bacillus ectoiniformans]MBM7647450.1 nucleotide-binding universal stress UspA family protein [Bacillus ectoiniformans]
MYKNILLAADGSKNSIRAAKEAVKIASLTDQSSIEIVFVADYAKSKSDILHSQSKEELEIARRKKILPIEEELQSHKLDYKVTILHGEPGPSIIEYANKNGFELVVIGSRGLNALQEMVLGSVSHKVVKRVNCPVLIVK